MPCFNLLSSDSRRKRKNPGARRISCADVGFNEPLSCYRELADVFRYLPWPQVDFRPLRLNLPRRMLAGRRLW
jgi:hypothetical protein